MSPAPAVPPRPASLHPQATISPIQASHIPALRRITSLLLPVNYPDSFWARLSDPQSSGAFSRVLLWTDSSSSSDPKVIGGLVCRPEPSPPTAQPAAAEENSLYIQSLVLLSPYRGLGLAAALLADAARAAAQSPWACAAVWAHVWTDNADGLRWYLARGFEREPGEIAGYYFKLRPDSAWIVRRRIDGKEREITSNGDGDGNGDGNGNNRVGGSLATAAPPAGATIPPSITAAAANLPPPPQSLAATSNSTSTTAPPPARPGPNPNNTGSSGLSFQNARPETEWNDLPADMHVSRNGSSHNLAVPVGGNSGGGGSGASSRSSSGGRKKKDRAYPAAAFGK